MMTARDEIIGVAETLDSDEKCEIVNDGLFITYTHIVEIFINCYDVTGIGIS